MNRLVYIVIHNQGIDGSYTVGAFSSYKKAQILCEMYNKTSVSNEYNFYSVNKIKVDEYNINDFTIETKDDWTTLKYKGKDF